MPEIDHSNEEQRLAQLVEQVLDEDQLFLVAVRIRGAKHQLSVKVFLDADQGLSIDKAAAISRQLGELIEGEALFPGKYQLEVGSPGLDMPLMLERQYKKNIGRTLKIRTADGKEVQGVLKEVKEESLSLEKKSKKADQALLEVDRKEIDKAYVTVSF